MSSSAWTSQGLTPELQDLLKQQKQIERQVCDLVDAGKVTHLQLLKFMNCGTTSMRMLLEDLQEKEAAIPAAAESLEMQPQSRMGDAEMDWIYQKFDRWMKQKDFQAVDDVLSINRFYIKQIGLERCLAYLTASLPAKTKLPSRAAFLARAMYVYGDNVFVGLD